jgi:hypothetical protein
MQRRTHNLATVLAFSLVVFALAGCETGEPEPTRDQTIDYRTGTEAWEYTTSGERGSIQVTEVNWAGSVRGSLEDGWSRDKDDIFIELRNTYFRPVYLEGWQVIVHYGNGRDPTARSVGDTDQRFYTFTIPARENKEPVDTNEYVTIAKKRDGAYPNADFYIEDLFVPADGFQIEIRDIDDRLIDEVGSVEQEAFAGSFDGVSARSMERVQLIFSNRGNRESSFHSYSNNPWEAIHERLARNIDEAYRSLTLASPGAANSVDYSGNTSSGSFE